MFSTLRRRSDWPVLMARLCGPGGLLFVPFDRSNLDTQACQPVLFASMPSLLLLRTGRAPSPCSIPTLKVTFLHATRCTILKARCGIRYHSCCIFGTSRRTNREWQTVRRFTEAILKFSLAQPRLRRLVSRVLLGSLDGRPRY